MKRNIIKLLAAIGIVLSFVSCSKKKGELELYDMGKATFKEPFVGLLKSHPGILVKSLKYPPYSWAAPDTAFVEKTFKISFNEDCVRSCSEAMVQIRDTHYVSSEGIRVFHNGEYISNGEFRVVADSLKKTMTLRYVLSPSLGKATIDGYILISGKELDSVNGKMLQQDNNVVGKWKCEQKIGWPIVLWFLWFLTALIILGIIGLIIWLIIKLLSAIFSAMSSSTRNPGKKIFDYSKEVASDRKNKENARMEIRGEKKSKRFFIPFVGTNYSKGINGKRVLVLGASFYCKNMECEHFSECTNVDKKDSSPYDTKCPEPGYRLSEAPSNEIGSMCDRGTYKKFASEMMRFTDTKTYEETWDRLAFTNYVQFFVPSEEAGKARLTLKSDMSERDFMAFNETLMELKPDVVIIWGTVINGRLMQQNEYLVDKKELEESKGYFCRIKLPEIGKTITLINPYHPSSSHWSSNIEWFEHYFRLALKR